MGRRTIHRRVLPMTPEQRTAAKAAHEAHLAEPHRPYVACLGETRETFLDYCERMNKTHTLRKCPMCGLFKLWIPKGEPDPFATATEDL